MTDWRQRLAIVSDETDDSFAAALRFCLPLGIRAYELRKLKGGRFPNVTERAVQKVAETAVGCGLDLVGVSPGFFKGPLCHPDVEATFKVGLPNAIRLMHRLGIKRMTLFTFRRPSREAAIPSEIYDHLGRAIEMCRREGIEVVLENVSSNYADTGANLARIARTLGVRVVWDPANAAASGEEAWPAGYGQVRDRLAHVHFKNWLPDAGVVAINDGRADLAGQVAALKADGYKGYFCLEPHQWHDRHNAVRLNTEQLMTLLSTE